MGDSNIWSLPGGRVDENETPEENIVREMEEEVGVKVAIQPTGPKPAVPGSATDFSDNDFVDKSSWHCFFFWLKQVDPEQELKVRR